MENKIEKVLIYLERKLYTKRKYCLGLCRDFGQYIRIYPILFRWGIVGILIYYIWGDQNIYSIIAKVIVTILCYLVVRCIIPRKSYESLG